MLITSVIPYFSLSVVFFAAASLLVKQSQFYQQVVQTSTKAKYTTFDGLRGFLALGVFFHHAVISYHYFQTGDWGDPHSRFYAFLGEGAVAFFFMITGFLFWSKAIAEGKFNLKKFYTARVLRIYPLYWFSLALMVLIVLVMSQFTLTVSWAELLYQVGRWMLCGVLDFPFVVGIRDSLTFPTINNIDASQINAGITWTLVYELQFYLILPLIAVFAKPWRFLALFVAVLLWNRVFPAQQTPMILIFVFGMAVAHLVSQFQLSQLFSNWKFSIVALLLLAAIPIVLPEPYLSNTEALILICAIFALFVYGNSLFGLLTAPASRCLGVISYSVYLLHGIVLFVGLNLVNWVYPIKGMNPIAFWLIVGLCGLLVISLSSLTYRFIEVPFLKAKPSSGALPETSVKLVEASDRHS